MNTQPKIIMKTIAVLMGFASILFAVYYLAITFGMGNLQLFAFMVIIIPSVSVVGAAFICGYIVPKWNWKRSLCIGLILAALIYGVGTFSTSIFNVAPDAISEQDKQMDKLYDELDRKAYEAMLEQGLISEGEKIYSGPVDGNAPDTNPKDKSDNDIAYSELYVGLTKSDTTSEILSAALNVLLAFGAGLAGIKVKMLSDKRKGQRV